MDDDMTFLRVMVKIPGRNYDACVSSGKGTRLRYVPYCFQNFVLITTVSH